MLCKPSVVQHAATPETLPKPPVADPVQKDNVCGTKEPPTPSTSQDYDPSNVSPIKNFLKELSIEDSQLLTEEVVVHEDFMSHLNSLSSEYILFKEEETTRKSTQKFEKASSQTKKDIDNVHVKLKSVEELLKGISGLVLDRNKLLLPSGMETLRLKREAVLKAVCAMNPVIELLKNTQRKLRVLNCQYRLKHSKEKVPYKITCGIGFVSWNDAYDGILMTDKELYPLDLAELYQVADMIENVSAAPLKELLYEVNPLLVSSQPILGAIRQICDFLPCIIVSDGQKHVVADLWQIAMEPSGSTFKDLLLMDSIEEENTGEQQEDNIQYFPSSYIPQKRGPVPLEKQFPEILTKTVDFIRAHSYSAQERRRTDIGNLSGVGLEDIRQHLMSEIPALK